jgi:hypothetical protein
MKRGFLIASGLLFLAGGCTSSATKQAIQDYHRSESFQQLAFNSASRTARDQMLLNLQQFIQLHPNDQVQIQAAISATWEARNQLETSREQFLLGKSLSQITVGQYLYNAQGPLNAWFGALSSQAQDTSTAAAQADKAAGVSSVTALLPKSTSTTQPSSVLSDFQDALKKITGK